MNSDRDDDFVAYSVQDLGRLWRWRVYLTDGQVAREGVADTEEGAQRVAAALAFGAPRAPATRRGGAIERNARRAIGAGRVQARL